MTNDEYLAELDLMIDIETVEVSEEGAPNEYLSFLLAAKGRNNTLHAAAMMIKRLSAQLPVGTPARIDGLAFLDRHDLLGSPLWESAK